MLKSYVPILCVLPGSACGYMIIKGTRFIHSDLEKIYKLEKEYGGCKFWFIESTTNSTGWHSHEAVVSKTLREDATIDKIRRLIEQLSYQGSDTENTKIKNKCQERKGQIVELAWTSGGNKDKWEPVETEWGNKEHKPATKK